MWAIITMPIQLTCDMELRITHMLCYRIETPEHLTPERKPEPNIKSWNSVSTHTKSCSEAKQFIWDDGSIWKIICKCLVDSKFKLTTRCTTKIEDLDCPNTDKVLETKKDSIQHCPFTGWTSLGIEVLILISILHCGPSKQSCPNKTEGLKD